MTQRPVAMGIGAIGCGGVAALVALPLTPFITMMAGWASYEAGLHRVKGDDFVFLSAGATALTVPAVGFLGALIGLGIGFALTGGSEAE
ncbi:MAG: hypothetical protein EP330_07190 [Deltaproteobacteria bacterium]|nr:MAG: hypothetical protein EP330_07190 [Deltaproteobacteria bacterium]